LHEAAEVLGIRRFSFVFEVLVPATLPAMFTGLRLSLQASWTTLVAAELIGATAGLGHVLTQGSLDIYPAMILVAMIAVAICGGIMTAMLGWLERWAMPWWSRT
jgi:NitT/TauT family transport system permease protein/taurine transport system permease protein